MKLYNISLIWALCLLLSNTLFPVVTVKLIEDNFNEPVYVASFPQNNNLLVLEQRGVIYLIKNGKRTKSPF